MQYCLLIFVIAGLVSTLEGSKTEATAVINKSEAGKITYDDDAFAVINISNELKNKFHVLEELANADMVKGSGKRVNEVRVTGTEIQVYVEKSRIWTESHEQIVFEPLSAPLIVAEKVKNNKHQDVAVKLTLEKVHAFLHTFGIWRQVYIYKNEPLASNLWEKDGIQDKNSEQLPALYILFKKL